MNCPRCRRDVSETVSFCPGCGAPLQLREELGPAALEASLTIDRRRGERTEADATVPRGVTAPIAPVRRAKEIPEVERSHWDMGSPQVGDAEPSARDVAAAAHSARTEPEVGSGGAVAPSAGAGAATVRMPPPVEHTGKLPADAFLQPDHDVPQTARPRVHVVRPETWRRAAAWGVDAVPFAAGAIWLARTFIRQAGRSEPWSGLDGFLDLVARERVIVLSVTVAAALTFAVYTTLSHALAGATLGKKLFALCLVGPDGERPTMKRSAVRSALGVLSALLLGLGFILALFTRSGRALHDFVARTWVVRAPP